MLRVPGGRNAAISYLQQLRSFEQPVVCKTESSIDATNGTSSRETFSLSRDLPQFPTNTQWALIRRMCVIDAEGRIQVTPLTESIQVRHYLEIPPESIRSVATQEIFDRAQQFTEFVMSRRQGGALRLIVEGEKEFRQFMSMGTDAFESSRATSDFQHDVLKSCATCHSGPGIYSVGTYTIFGNGSPLPPELVEGRPEREAEATISWKHQQIEWGLLQGLWDQTN
jgi:hypothetical protein